MSQIRKISVKCDCGESIYLSLEQNKDGKTIIKKIKKDKKNNIVKEDKKDSLSDIIFGKSISVYNEDDINEIDEGENEDED